MNCACNKQYSKDEIKKINKYIKELYDLSFLSLNKANSIQFNQSLMNTSILIDKSSYISEPIRKYIEKNKKFTYKFNTIINQKNITLYFVYFMQPSNKTLSYHSKIAFMVIFMLTNKIKNNCSKNIEIKLFLTPFKKVFPSNKTDVLGPNEVNTGFSTIGCNTTGNITIYRDEEWVKVLIHELFHNLDLDFSGMNIVEFKKKLYEIFKIKSTYEISETYTEMWARIINVVISCTIKTNTYNEFSKLFEKAIEEERVFSLMQASIILDRITSIKEYKEESNIFCYYILTAALFNNYLHFFEWCSKNNMPIINFKKTNHNIQSFIDLLLLECDSSSFKSSIVCVNKFAARKLKHSLKMTIITPFME